MRHFLARKIRNMPSCVISSCKNNSTGQSKSTRGITFHKFPKDKDWKNKWIGLIRASRDQATWIPSKFSVVCSVHFDDNDMYTTKKGNRKIKKEAVPVLKLFENDHILEDDSQSVHANTEPANDEEANNKMVTDSEEQIQKFIIKVEQSEYVETSEIGTQTNDLDENIKIKEEPKEDSDMEKVEQSEYVETSEIGTQTNDLDENIKIKEEPKEDSDMETSIDPLADQHNAGNYDNVVPDSSHYERELEVVTAQLNESRRKTKTLLEKLIRSEKRNLKMKNILKEIKVRKLIDRDVFRELTACLFEKD